MRFTFLSLSILMTILLVSPACAQWTKELAQPQVDASIVSETSPVAMVDKPVIPIAPSEEPAASRIVTVQPPQFSMQQSNGLVITTSNYEPPKLIVTVRPTFVVRQMQQFGSPVPEPGSILALASGLAGLAFKLRRR